MVNTAEISPTEISDIENEDDTTMKVVFIMSKNTWKRLGEIALDREASRASLVREAIKEYMKTLEKPAEQKIIIPDRQLNKILEACSKEDGGYEIDGENGFVAYMEAKGFKLKDLTPNQWEKVKEKLRIGYDGYWDKSGFPEEFVEKFDALEPSEEQKTWLSKESEKETEEEEL